MSEPFQQSNLLWLS